ncbi:MAG: hypothetical protein Kow00121_58710 [Elainellaceae cyanobacterium]
MADFTVAIPTYNGEQRLPDVLERLRSQQIYLDALCLKTFSWEVLVVDNNSQDQTAKVVETFQAEFPCPLRYCLELQQGAAYARNRAIREAASELIGFLDDDNLPDLDWVVAAYKFAQTHPCAAAYGSQIRGEFEIEPAAELQRILPFFAITQRGCKPLQYQSRLKVLPPSAGLVVRKSIWVAHVPSQTILSGRINGSMLTGEDTEVLAYILKAGGEIWYDPAMKVTHKIPAWRLNRDYLIPFFRGIGLSRYVTRMASVQPKQRSLMTIAYMVNDLRKIVFHLVKYRTQVRTNLGIACELELFIYSLISPIYLWRHGYLDKSNSTSQPL